MTVMTRTAFVTKSNAKDTTKRSAALVEIDVALDAYHTARNVVPSCDEDDVKNKLELLLTKVTAYQTKYDEWHVNWKRRKTRKDALVILRNQIESALYQLPTDFAQHREDLRYFNMPLTLDELFDPVPTLSANLKRLKLRAQSCSEDTNRLSKELHTGISDFFKTEGLRLRDDQDLGPLWQKLITGAGEGNNPTRCALVDLSKLLDTTDNTPFVAFAKEATLTAVEKKAMWNKLKNPQDPVVGTALTENQPAAQFSPALRGTLIDYLRALCGGELGEQVELINEALASEPGYRCVVHFDYYASRATNNPALHKDTNGTNLFAVLHYLNDEPIVGPEWIDDPAPLVPRTISGEAVNSFYAAHANIPNRARMGAPWSERQPAVVHPPTPAKYVWPRALLTALHNARGTGTTLEYSPLPANGLVTFVDELIFHGTPMLGLRPPGGTTDEQIRHLGAGATIPGGVGMKGTAWTSDDSYLPVFGVRDYTHRVQRRMSITQNKALQGDTDMFLGGLPIPRADSGGVRKFWRLWIAIAPAHWYVPTATTVT